MLHFIQRFQFTCVLWLLLCLTAMGADVRWVGNAQDVAQVSTITVTGTWATGDVATIACNAKSVTVTVGVAVSTANIAEILGRAINADDADDNLHGTESRNVGGQSIPEFTEITASYSGAVLTLRSTTPGVPFTVTRSETTAGDGALGAVTEVVAATGKNWLNNAANYDTGSVPADNDVLYIDEGSVDILYALDHFRTNNIDLDTYITQNYTGDIGRPYRHPLGYIDYRANRYYQARCGSKLFKIGPSTPVVANAAMRYLDFQSQTGVTLTIDTGSTPTSPTIFITGSSSGASGIGNVTITTGNVYIEPDDTTTNSVLYFKANGSITIGKPGGAANAAIVTFGRRTFLDACSAVTVNSGTVVTYTDPCPLIINGGSFEVKEGTTGLAANIYAGGTLYLSSPTGWTGSEANVYGGTLDISRCPGVASYSDINVYAGSTLNDPAGNSILFFDAIGCKLSQLTLNLASNRTWDASTEANP